MRRIITTAAGASAAVIFNETQPGRTDLFGGTLGSSGIKTAEQAAIYGDTAGVAYDHCCHQACDTVASFSATGLNRCPTRPPARWSAPPTAHAQRPPPRQGRAAPPCNSTTTSRRAGSPPDPTSSEGRWRTIGTALPPASVPDSETRL